MASSMGENQQRTKRDNKSAQVSGAQLANGRRSAKGFPDYLTAVEYLRNRVNVEQSRPSQVDVAKAFNLDRMVALMEELGNPHRSFKSIHVGGSKGKGSTCEMTAASLRACGYTVGLYTSPHLVHLGERIRINDVPIGLGEFTTLLSRVADGAAKMPRKHGEPTYFELLTALAFVQFAEQAVDVAVVEVGMGGRLDATNVIIPEVCALSAIQLEHTLLLGDTLEKIAAEKAGIFKAGVPVVTVPQTAGVLAVLKEAAGAAGTTIESLNQELEFSYRFEASPELGHHARVCLSTKRSNFEHLPVPLKGEHQAYNCGLMLAILDRLRERGMATPEGAVARGLAKTPSNGRLEQIHSSPRVLIDGAHNPDSIAALVKAVGVQVRYDSMVVVFGCAADKDVVQMLRNIGLGADKIIFTKAESSLRAMDPRELHRKFAEVSGKMAQVAQTLQDAISLASRAVSRDDLILVTGSFALAGEAKRLLSEKAAMKREAQADHAVLREVKQARATTGGSKKGTPSR